jgi:hypothetical protein
VPTADGLIVTGNAPVELLAGTVTVAGTVAIEVLLLASETVAPPDGVRAVNANVAEVPVVPVWTVEGLNVIDSSAPPGSGGGGGVTVMVAVRVTPLYVAEITDVGVWRPATQTFLLRDGLGTVERTRFGHARDVPVAGDWNGDLITDLGVWRPAKRTFRLLRQDGSVQVIRLGAVGSQPVTGDWNGDGLAELGVFNAGAGMFVLRTVAADGSVSLVKVPLGDAGSLPVVGDWDGDGVDDLGIWSRATATFSLRTSAGVTRTRFGLPRR